MTAEMTRPETFRDALRLLVARSEPMTAEKAALIEYIRHRIEEHDNLDRSVKKKPPASMRPVLAKRVSKKDQ